MTDPLSNWVNHQQGYYLKVEKDESGQEKLTARKRFNFKDLFSKEAWENLLDLAKNKDSYKYSNIIRHVAEHQEQYASTSSKVLQAVKNINDNLDPERKRENTPFVTKLGKLVTFVEVKEAIDQKFQGTPYPITFGDENEGWQVILDGERLTLNQELLTQQQLKLLYTFLEKGKLSEEESIAFRISCKNSACTLLDPNTSVLDIGASLAFSLSSLAGNSPKREGEFFSKNDMPPGIQTFSQTKGEIHIWCSNLAKDSKAVAKLKYVAKELGAEFVEKTNMITIKQGQLHELCDACGLLETYEQHQLYNEIEELFAHIYGQMNDKNLQSASLNRLKITNSDTTLSFDNPELSFEKSTKTLQLNQKPWNKELLAPIKSVLENISNLLSLDEIPPEDSQLQSSLFSLDCSLPSSLVTFKTNKIIALLTSLESLSLESLSSQVCKLEKSETKIAVVDVNTRGFSIEYDLKEKKLSINGNAHPTLKELLAAESLLTDLKSKTMATTHLLELRKLGNYKPSLWVELTQGKKDMPSSIAKSISCLSGITSATDTLSKDILMVTEEDGKYILSISKPASRQETKALQETLRFLGATICRDGKWRVSKNTSNLFLDQLGLLAAPPPPPPPPLTGPDPMIKERKTLEEKLRKQLQLLETDLGIKSQKNDLMQMIRTKEETELQLKKAKEDLLSKETALNERLKSIKDSSVIQSNYDLYKLLETKQDKEVDLEIKKIDYKLAKEQVELSNQGNEELLENIKKLEKQISECEEDVSVLNKKIEYAELKNELNKLVDDIEQSKQQLELTKKNVKELEASIKEKKAIIVNLGSKVGGDDFLTQIKKASPEERKGPLLEIMDKVSTVPIKQLDDALDKGGATPHEKALHAIWTSLLNNPLSVFQVKEKKPTTTKEMKEEAAAKEAKAAAAEAQFTSELEALAAIKGYSESQKAKLQGRRDAAGIEYNKIKKGLEDYLKKINKPLEEIKERLNSPTKVVDEYKKYEQATLKENILNEVFQYDLPRDEIATLSSNDLDGTYQKVCRTFAVLPDNVDLAYQEFIKINLTSEYAQDHEEKTLTPLRDKIPAQVEEVEKAQQKLDQENEKLDQLTTQINELENALKPLEKLEIEYINLENTLETLTSRKIEIEEQQKKPEKKSEEVTNQLTQELERINTSSTEHQQEITNLEQKLIIEKFEEKKAERKRLVTQLEAQQTQVKQTTDDLENKHQSLKNINKEINELFEKIQTEMEQPSQKPEKVAQSYYKKRLEVTATLSPPTERTKRIHHGMIQADLSTLLDLLMAKENLPDKFHLFLNPEKIKLPSTLLLQQISEKLLESPEKGKEVFSKFPVMVQLWLIEQMAQKQDKALMSPFMNALIEQILSKFKSPENKDHLEARQLYAYLSTNQAATNPWKNTYEELLTKIQTQLHKEKLFHYVRE